MKLNEILNAAGSSLKVTTEGTIRVTVPELKKLFNTYKFVQHELGEEYDHECTIVMLIDVPAGISEPQVKALAAKATEMVDGNKQFQEWYEYYLGGGLVQRVDDLFNACDPGLWVAGVPEGEYDVKCMTFIHWAESVAVDFATGEGDEDDFSD